MDKIGELKFDSQGLIPAIVQDRKSGQVLMLAYMNKESLQKTLESGETVFWSRSRNSLWHKGETSGNTQKVCSVQHDCDNDTLLITVEQKGNACHTGAYSCFNETLPGRSEQTSFDDLGTILKSLAQVIRQRKQEMPEKSYTTYLFKSGLDKILKKVGEEAAETIIAAKNHSKEELSREVADLFYHLLVLLEQEGVALEDISRVLSLRSKAAPENG